MYLDKTVLWLIRHTSGCLRVLEKGFFEVFNTSYGIECLNWKAFIKIDRKPSSNRSNSEIVNRKTMVSKKKL